MEGVMAGNADFFEANLERTKLRGASLVTSNCYGAALYQAETDGADFTQALVGNTILAKR
ncbi:Pentapeptide repeats (8 copies) [compost metagenome]